MSKEDFIDTEIRNQYLTYYWLDESFPELNLDRGAYEPVIHFPKDYSFFKNQLGMDHAASWKARRWSGFFYCPESDLKRKKIFFYVQREKYIQSNLVFFAKAKE
jgi:hypothetical protein